MAFGWLFAATFFHIGGAMNRLDMLGLRAAGHHFGFIGDMTGGRAAREQPRGERHIAENFSLSASVIVRLHGSFEHILVAEIPAEKCAPWVLTRASALLGRGALVDI